MSSGTLHIHVVHDSEDSTANEPPNEHQEEATPMDHRQSDSSIRRIFKPRLPLLPALLLAVVVVALPAAVSLAGPGGGHGHGEHQPEAHGAEAHDAQGPDDHAHHRAMLGADLQVERVGSLQIPDLPVLTQDGREVHFFSDLIEGKVVAMNFVFTTCRTICPPLGANFGKLQAELGQRLNEDVRLISVSVDPVTDTPERLRAWGETFGAGPGWTLVTGSKDQITRLLKSLQVFTPDIRDHSPTVLVGNAATGTWTRAYGLAPPPELAKMIDQVSSGSEPARLADHDHGPGHDHGGSER